MNNNTGGFNMKKLFAILAIMLMVLVTLYGASAARIEDENLVIGDPEYYKYEETISFWDKLFGGSQALTVVGGAMCTLNPSASSEEINSYGDDTICYMNTAHIGVAFQLFDPTGRFVGEKQVLKGTEQCFTGIEPNKVYHIDLYYCDITSGIACTETDSGADYTKKGTTTITMAGQTAMYTDSCYDANNVKEYYCDADKSLASKLQPCPCSNGICTTPVAPLKIDIRNVQILDSKGMMVSSVDKDTVYTIKGEAVVSGKCVDCVIESGLGYYGTPLSIALPTSSTGACGDDKTVGVRFAAENTVVQFTLKDKATTVGKYNLQVIASPYCKSGIILDTAAVQLEVKTPYVKPPCTTGSTDPSCPCTGSACPVDSKVCYWCDGEAVKSASFPQCPDGTVLSQPDCTVPPIACGDAANPEQNGCIPQECETNPSLPVCIPGGIDFPGETTWWETIKGYFDFENSPTTAYGLTLLIILIVVLLAYILMPSGNSSRRKRR